jgi:hypothetical protein
MVLQRLLSLTACLASFRPKASSPFSGDAAKTA